MTVARARANGAISVVNAIVSGGLGGSVAIGLRTEAKVVLLEDVPEVEVIIDGKEAGDEGFLARLALKGVVARLGCPDWGGRVETTSDIPMARGLKSSSAAANAIVLATSQAMHLYEGESLSRADLLEAAIDAALDAGVTITGAYDDATASMHGGVCITDNAARKLITREDVDASMSAVLLVPPEPRATASVRDLPYEPFRPLAQEAHLLARRGRWLDALTMNGLVAGALYGAPAEWTRAALSSGAVAAGLSGKGPAFAAVAREADAKAVEAVLQTLAPQGARVLVAPLTNARAEVLA